MYVFPSAQRNQVPSTPIACVLFHKIHIPVCMEYHFECFMYVYVYICIALQYTYIQMHICITYMHT